MPRAGRVLEAGHQRRPAGRVRALGFVPGVGAGIAIGVALAVLAGWVS